MLTVPETQVFEITKAAVSVWTVLLVLVPLSLLLAVAYLAWPRALRVEVSPDHVQIRGSVYGKRIPKADLELAAARVVDLTAESPLAFASRSNGIALPGYSVGWFHLKNGERALAFVTDRRQVVYVPTRNRYALLMTVSEPTAFLAALDPT
jgi:hypothetical protein